MSWANLSIKIWLRLMNIGKNCRPNANLRGLDKGEKFMEKKITLITGDDNELTVSGTDEEIKKVLKTLGEFRTLNHF